MFVNVHQHHWTSCPFWTPTLNTTGEYLPMLSLRKPESSVSQYVRVRTARYYSNSNNYYCIGINGPRREYHLYACSLTRFSLRDRTTNSTGSENDHVSHDSFGISQFFFFPHGGWARRSFGNLPCEIHALRCRLIHFQKYPIGIALCTYAQNQFYSIACSWISTRLLFSERRVYAPEWYYTVNYFVVYAQIGL